MMNAPKLYRELVNAGIPVEGCASDGRMDFKPEATQAQRDQAAAILAAHDPTDTDKLNVDDVKARWHGNQIAGKTPAEIYTLMQIRIDGWTSLSAAKADLREWLPMLAAALAWTAMQDAQR